MQIPLPGPGDITVKEEGVVLCSWRAQMCNRQVTKNVNAVNEINRAQHWSMMWAGASHFMVLEAISEKVTFKLRP